MERLSEGGVKPHRGERLIRRYIALPPEGCFQDVDRLHLKESGIDVWAIAGYLRASGGVKQTAQDYEISSRAVLAAVAVYERHTDIFDARLLLNAGRMVDHLGRVA